MDESQRRNNRLTRLKVWSAFWGRVLTKRPESPSRTSAVVARHARLALLPVTDNANNTAHHITHTGWRNNTHIHTSLYWPFFTWTSVSLFLRFFQPVHYHSLGQLTSTDLASAKGKTKVSWLILFHSLIRQCFNILIRHFNPSRIRNIKQNDQNNYITTIHFLCFPSAETRSAMWRQLTERMGQVEHFHILLVVNQC